MRKIITKETREKMREAKLGKKNHMYGKLCPHFKEINKLRKGKTWEEIYGKEKARKMKDKINLDGEKNPNYRNGNRITGNFPCPLCGRSRICEKRNSNRPCWECYNSSREKKFDRILWYKIKRHELKKFCFDYLGGKCARCNNGNLPLCCYHFHHRNSKEKDFTIGNLLNVNNNKQKNKLKKELDKCDLLCANCHSIIHWEKEYTS